MTIETKFNVGDTIAYIDAKEMRVREEKVTCVNVYARKAGVTISYDTESKTSIGEEDVRSSKDEILESLNRPF